MTGTRKTGNRRSARCAASAWALVPLIGLSACVGPDGGAQGPPVHLGADFGNAVTHNAAQHVIDPAPEHARATAPPMDGARGARAVTRYREGAVTPLNAVETTDFGDER